MEIKEVTKQEDHSADLTANLSPEQLQYVVSVGLNVLMKAGAYQIEVNKARNADPGKVIITS